MMQQPLLFIAPKAIIPRLTPEQWIGLTTLSHLGHQPLFGSAYKLNRRVLRALIRKGCIEVCGLTPAIYRVTKLGSIARSMHRAR